MFIMPNEAWSAILGAAVGALITYRFAVTLADRQFQHLRAISKLDAWHAAAQEFITAFAGDLLALETGADLQGDLMDFFRSAHRARHAQAVAVFRQHLSGSRQTAFNEEWQRHCYGQRPDGTPKSTDDEDIKGITHEELLFVHYSAPSIYHTTQSARKFAIERIINLLSYAR